MIRALAAAVVSALCTSPAMAVSERFDLRCEGQSSGFENGQKYTRPFARTLHVDLIKGEFCYDNCEAVSPIFHVDSFEMVFADKAFSKSEISRFRDVEKVDRRSGAYTRDYLNSDKLEFFKVNAMCAAAAFTPFPETKF